MHAKVYGIISISELGICLMMQTCTGREKSVVKLMSGKVLNLLDDSTMVTCSISVTVHFIKAAITNCYCLLNISAHLSFQAKDNKES